MSNYKSFFVFIIVASSLVKYAKFGSMSAREAGLLWQKSETGNVLMAGLFLIALAPEAGHLV